jgi:hypothetical protein
MATAPTSSASQIEPQAKRSMRYTQWGSILLSFDFYLGVPIGVALGILPAFDKAAATMATTVLVTFGGALVAIVAVVVAAKTIFVTLLSPEYLLALERIEGGLKSATRPYIVVAWVCVVGLLTSFAAVLGWPAIPGHGWWLRWLVFSLPACLSAWGLLGAVQLVTLQAFHLEQRETLMRAVQEFRRRREASRSA